MLVAVLAGKFSQAAIMFVKVLQLFFRPVFQINESIAGAFEGGDKFIELELNRRAESPFLSSRRFFNVAG